MHIMFQFILLISADLIDTDSVSDVKRPRLSSYEPDEVKPMDAAGVKGAPNLEQSIGSALPKAIPLDRIQVCCSSAVF